MRSGQREPGVDVLKGLAVCCMVFAHTVQLLPPGNGAYTWFAYYVVNVAAFPAFLFCFGYACRRAYLEKPRAVAAPRLAAGFVRTLAALYACGLAWLACTGALGLKSAAKLALWLELPAYSEFLLSFALVYPLVWALHGALRRLVANGWAVALAAVCGLALTQLPYAPLRLPVVGALVGAQGLSVFPLAQYAGYFLAGAWFSGREKRFCVPVAVCAALGTAAFYGAAALQGEYPARFPPAALWVAGGAGWVYAGWLLCMRAGGTRAVRALGLAYLGRHSLWFLVASNMMLFVLHRAGLRPGVLGLPGSVLHPAVCLAVLLAAGGLCAAVQAVRAAVRRAGA